MRTSNGSRADVGEREEAVDMGEDIHYALVAYIDEVLQVLKTFTH